MTFKSYKNMLEWWKFKYYSHDKCLWLISNILNLKIQANWFPGNILAKSREEKYDQAYSKDKYIGKARKFSRCWSYFSEKNIIWIEKRSLPSQGFENWFENCNLFAKYRKKICNKLLQKIQVSWKNSPQKSAI